MGVMNPQWSPTGRYEIQLFSGGGCNNFLYWSADNDIVAQTWYYQNGGAQESYRMRTHGDYAAFEFHDPWSNCFDFTLVSEAEQKKKDTAAQRTTCARAFRRNGIEPRLCVHILHASR
jgi:hypothetical protein